MKAQIIVTLETIGHNNKNEGGMTISSEFPGCDELVKAHAHTPAVQDHYYRVLDLIRRAVETAVALVPLIYETSDGMQLKDHRTLTGPTMDDINRQIEASDDIPAIFKLGGEDEELLSFDHIMNELFGNESEEKGGKDAESNE